MELLFGERGCEHMGVSFAQQVVQRGRHACEVGNEAPIYIAGTKERAHLGLVTGERGVASRGKILLCRHKLAWPHYVAK